MGNQVEAKENQDKAPALSVETLKANHADIYQAVLDQGAKAERERIQGVEALAMPGHEALIDQFKYDGATTAEAAAVQILKAEKTNRESALAQVREEAPAPLAPTAQEPKATNQENLTQDEKIQKTWDSNADVREEFGDFESFKAFEEATAAGSARRLGGK